MKRLIAIIGATVLLTAPALAATMTLSFATDDGETTVWTLNNADNTASNGEVTLPFTWDAEAKTLCAQAEEGEICATMDTANDAPAVGDTSTYTTNTGVTGTVTIIAIEE